MNDGRTVLLLSRAGAAGLPEDIRRRLEDTARLVVHPVPGRLGAAESASLLAEVDILASTNLALPVLDEALLQAAPRLAHVVLYATGYEHIDVGLLDRRGITLTTLPDYATTAVAEHALALIMALAARVPLANDRSRGLAPAGVSLRGFEVAGRTLGIVGTGRIGRHLARIARGIGMTVIGTDIDPLARVRAAADGIQMVVPAHLVAQADVVAICASTIQGTFPILDAAAIAALKPGAVVVSVGRPVLVDTPAMLAALRGHVVRGYAVDDVIAGPDFEDPAVDLIAEGRLLQTGHSAWWRDEVLDRGGRMFADAILAAACGHPVNVVHADNHHAEGRWVG